MPISSPPTGGGASAGSTNYRQIWEEEAGSSAASSAADTKRGFLDSEKNNVPSFIDENGVVTIIDEVIDVVQTTAANLETNYPAASNEGLFAWVAGTTSDNGLYLSSGSAWAKQLDNAGDQEELPAWAGGLVFSGATDLATLPGVAYWRMADEVTDVTITATYDLDDAFDGNSVYNTPVGNFAYSGTATGDDKTGSSIYKLLTTPIAMGRFTMSSGQTANSVSGFRLKGYRDHEDWDYLTVGVLPSPLTSSDNILVLGALGSTVYLIPTTNTTIYKGYGVELVTFPDADNVAMTEYGGEIVTDNTAGVTTVRGVRYQYRGRRAIETAAVTATPTTLDATQCVVPFDATSANITCNIPAVADVQTGKIYTIKKTDSSANTITIDGDGAETIEGSTTYVLSKQNDTVTIQSDGTEWWVTSYPRGIVAPIASPTFTGTVAGITKAMVGLTSVDDTADTAKPVSTAQQTALNLKANKAAPVFTGDATFDTDTLVVDAANDRIGINQTAPTDAVDVSGGGYVLDEAEEITWKKANRALNRGSVSVDASGNVIIKTEDALTEKVRVLAAGGITFNGDTAAANAIDDYEEGTFTPAFSNIGTGTYGSQVVGTYTKVGDEVSCQLQLTMATIGTAAGDLIVAGFPFTSSSTAYEVHVTGAVYGNGWASAASDVVGIMSPSATVLTLYKDMPNTTSTKIQHSEIGATGNLIFNITYKV